ncbi:MAG: hypothetical protein WDW38_004748 [Sanguina aurantia]
MLQTVARLCSVLRLLALQFPPPLSSETRAAPEATEFETVLLALRAMPALGLPPWKKAAEWRAEGLTAECAGQGSLRTGRSDNTPPPCEPRASTEQSGAHSTSQTSQDTTTG